MKKNVYILTVILTAILVMSFAPVAFADEITEVNITVTPPKVGEYGTDVPVDCSIIGSGYTIDAAVWYGGGYQTYEIYPGNTYKATLRITAESGNSFNENTTVTVNGEDANIVARDITTYGYIEIDYSTEPQAEEITAIDLTGVPKASIGSAAGAPYSQSTSEYKAEGKWYAYDRAAGTYTQMNTTDAFEQGGIYRFRIDIAAEKGYYFGTNYSLSVDGEDCTYALSFYGNFSAYTDIYTSFTDEISRADISSADIPKAEIGKTFSDTTISIPVPQGSNYTAAGYWFCVDENGYEQRAGAFENGKEYFFHIDITPNSGYSLSEYFELYIDSEDTGFDYQDRAQAGLNIRKSFAAVIDSVELLNLTAPAIGTKLPSGSFPVAVPAGANYTAEATWFEYSVGNGYSPVDPADGSDTVKNGKVYSIDVQITTNTGYELAEFVTVKAFGGLTRQSASYTGTLYSREFSFRSVIDKVEVLGVAAPALGEAPDLSGIKVPAGANYKITDAEWLDTDSSTPAAVFEKGHDYFIYISVKANDGYEFSPDAAVLLNGKAPEDFYFDSYTQEVHIGETVSFREVLTEVRIDGVADMQVGKTASTAVTVPAGAKYTAAVGWNVWDDSTKIYGDFSGVFEKGKAYQRHISVYPAEGYRFDADTTKLFINGKQHSDAYITNYYIDAYDGFSAGLNVIDRIEFTVGEPVSGNHASIPPTVTALGSNYTVDINMEVMWLKGDIDNYRDILDNEYFSAGGSYGVLFYVTANEGYVFADDVEVAVNGVTLPKEAVDIYIKHGNITYFFNMTSASGDREKDDIPKMDDTAVPVLPIAAALVIAGTVLYATTVKKRKAN